MSRNFILQSTEVTSLKIVDILLNKVKGISWNYFDISLNNVTASSNSTAYKDLMMHGKITHNIDSLLNSIGGDSAGEFMSQSSRASRQVEQEIKLDSTNILNIIRYVEYHPDLLQKVISRIFDMNVTLNGNNIATNDARSSAKSGIMGKLNKQEKKRRDKVFRKIFRKKPDFRAKDGNYVVLAEGDSWFCFPRVYIPSKPFRFTRFLLRDPVKDIIDNLIRFDNIAVFSLAAGGDWLNNMLDNNAQEYIEPLSRLSPDVFLVSGGGNDMVSNNRISHMVRLISQIGENSINFEIGENEKGKNSFENLWKVRRKNKDLESEEYKKLYKRGLELISEEYLRFMNICMVQYFTLFFKLLKNTDKFKDMLIITQGYDYAIPSKDRKGKLWFLSWQKILKTFMNNGRWLYDSLVMKGIHKPFDQRAAIFTMMYEFNEMLASIAQYDEFPNVFHLDIRGFAKKGDWFDELHLKSKPYKQISGKIKEIIETYSPKLKLQIKIPSNEKVIKMRG